MVEQLHLADDDVPYIADFIDFVIMRISPEWKPSSNSHSSLERSASGLTLIADQWETPSTHGKQDSPYAFHFDPRILAPTRDGNNLCDKFHNASPHITFMLTNTGNNLSNGSITSEVFAGDSIRKSDMSKVLEADNCEKEFGIESRPRMDQSAENSQLVLCGRDGLPNVSSLEIDCSSTLSSGRRDRHTQMKLELDAIETQYEQWFQELSRMKHEAIEVTKKRWMSKD